MSASFPSCFKGHAESVCHDLPRRRGDRTGGRGTPFRGGSPSPLEERGWKSLLLSGLFILCVPDCGGEWNGLLSFESESVDLPCLGLLWSTDKAKALRA